VTAAVRCYDDTIARGESLMNDEQLRRIASLRTYRGDRIRPSANSSDQRRKGIAADRGS